MLTPLRPVAARRRAAALTLILLVVVVVGLGAQPALLEARVPNPAPVPLRDLARHHGKRFGTAIDTTALASEPAYAALAEREFSSVTPENVMKWQVVEPEQGVFNYGPADGLVQFARDNNQVVHGHTLVWHNQLPAWLTGGSFSNAELAAILHRHIVQEVRHFGEKVQAWDVVNEPLNEDGTLRNTIWLQALGPDYIAQAFIWAHEANPEAKLYINEFNLEFTGPKSNAMLTLVQGLRARKVPIDGVGFQGHLAIQFGFPDLENNLRRFADLGVEVALTEADARMILPATPDKLATQADFYRQMMQACLDVRRCVGMTVWGFTDAHSWVPGTFTGQGAADIFDEALRPKPAYTALVQTLSSQGQD